jgi:hypothetical protein
MNRETIPPGVVEALYQYRDANVAAQAGYFALCDAVRRGGGGAVKKIEAGRDERRRAQDRTRAALDEAVRAW